MLPTTIDFRITSNCNMTCPFCFGTKVSNHADISAHIEFLGKIRDHGVNNIVITGGEPTCYPGFSELLRTIHSLGYRIALSTNGTFWNHRETRDAVFEYVSFLSLPIESSDPTIHNLLRPGVPDHYKLVHKILKDISTLNLNTQLKIGTVVTRINIDSMSGILDSLPVEPSIWKLYQLSSCEFNHHFYDANHIPDDEFTKCVDQLQKQYSDRPTRIVSGYELDRDNKYLFLDPDGSLKTIIRNQEAIIGHISEETPSLYRRIGQVIDHDKINANFLDSFT